MFDKGQQNAEHDEMNAPILADLIACFVACYVCRSLGAILHLNRKLDLFGVKLNGWIRESTTRKNPPS